MCGIIGYVGKNKALPIIIDGLTALEYRGYDSAGISYNMNDKIYTVKEQGKLDNLKKEIKLNIDTNMAIGHTRWATHGKPNKINAHPHTKGKITLVHNGIIENYQELKNKLNYDFLSETDSEVIAALIDDLYSKNKNIKKTLIEVKKQLKGSYALAIMVENDETLYAIRKDSPLIVSHTESGNFIASDVPAILKYTNKYITIEENEIACLSKDKLEVYNDSLKLVTKQEQTFNGNYENICKNGFEHFMVKEIYEQPSIFSKTIIPLLENKLADLPDFSDYQKIEIIGCGSAYNAGLVGKHLIEKLGNVEVNVYIASEYRYNKIFHNKNTLAIFISQSGETADTLAALNKATDEGLDTLGIINVKDSAIARKSKNVIYTNAGCEIAVATTKAYSAQVAILSLIALKISKIDCSSIIAKARELPSLMTKLLNYDYERIAKELYNHEHIYFIGRGIDYTLCLEGSLKLKEISYIHSEAYPAGELKHGTIALIEDNTPVIALTTDKELIDKTMNNIKEVKARNAKVINIGINGDIKIPSTLEIFTPLLSIIPLQLISYQVAKLRGCDIDKPKNLAKSVTVE